MNLTKREVEILQVLVEGLSDKEVGVRLNISRRTVQSHLARIFVKLSVKNRVSAVAKFLKYYYMRNAS